MIANFYSRMYDDIEKVNYLSDKGVLFVPVGQNKSSRSFMVSTSSSETLNEELIYEKKDRKKSRTSLGIVYEELSPVQEVFFLKFENSTIISFTFRIFNLI